MLLFPNAKINLGLFVTEKRKDGYHNLETVFYPVPLHDALEVLEAPKDELQISGLPVVGAKEDNLVWKALLLMRQSFPVRIPPVSIHLLKQIPMGAGMGGGSSDAAFMLALLNKKFALEATEEQLLALALQLGSDCPFFIKNRPSFAMGRGEQLSAIELDLTKFSLQIAFPKVHVATATAFAGIQPKSAPFDLRSLAALPIDAWREKVQNDFEYTVFQKHPELSALKSIFYQQGALYASMSGSGSTIFGIFGKGEKADLPHGMQQWYFE